MTEHNSSRNHVRWVGVMNNWPGRRAEFCLATAPNERAPHARPEARFRYPRPRHFLPVFKYPQCYFVCDERPMGRRGRDDGRCSTAKTPPNSITLPAPARPLSAWCLRQPEYLVSHVGRRRPGINPPDLRMDGVYDMTCRGVRAAQATSVQAARSASWACRNTGSVMEISACGPNANPTDARPRDALTIR